MKNLVAENIEAAQLAALYQRFRKKQDETRADNVLDLLEKWQKKEFVISFAGHFSAGKSTMINTILEEEILPQSPIPTSANVVKVSAGEGAAKIFFKEENPVWYREPYDLDTIQSFCKDGDRITRIEISKDTEIIPPGVSVVDTPGIDSSNDADRVITESSLHVVDVLFYVMDYNHVQSEVNLAFLQKIQKSGKPFYLVINQIDKHQEAELTFKDFQEKVRDTFRDWGIFPADIFYTSLLDHEHSLNQLELLKKSLYSLMENKQEMLENTISNAVPVLVEKHLAWLEEQNAEERDIISNQLKQLKGEKFNEVSLEEKEAEKQHLQTVVKEIKQQFRHAVDSTLKNAYLMPFELREKAESFLSSREPNFKVGFLKTKKKTEAARQERLDSFYTALMETVEAAIQWKLRDKLLEVLKHNDVKYQQVTNQVQALSVSYPKDRLEQIIKPGAQVTGEYLLIYTDDLSADIKQKYKQEVLKIWEQLEVFLDRETEQEVQMINVELKELAKVKGLEEQLAALEAEVTEQRFELTSRLLEAMSAASVANVEKALLQRNEAIQFSNPQQVRQDKVTPAEQSKLSTEETFAVNQKSGSVDQMVEKVSRAIELISDIPGLNTVTEDLKNKRESLVNRHYTVALFGAFSAGKSSFANALMGEKVLPVSPNPTTAAINKISPPNEQYSHGTVLVKLKDEAALLADLRQVVEELPCQSLAEAVDWINKELLAENYDLEAKQKSFLHAVSEGYHSLNSKLADRFTITFQEFPEYVANESLACFVEWMELFYDCSLTRQGITLVDTPGADSINSRHTDVAFEYIKQADAILFVTYYNHAFSKADKDFLTQLGRVKDAFSMDKMFFIVNAADLAKDKEELQMVTAYVADHLVEFGIRSPRMFPISSKLAMAGKQENNKLAESGLPAFEQSFYHFVKEELTELLVSSCSYDIIRANNMVKKYITSASMDNKEKVNLIKQYKEQLGKIKAELNNQSAEHYVKEIKQKTEKQLYYVNQRMTIQFNDRFKEAFNPATIKGNAREARPFLEKSLKEFLQDNSYQLGQELRAVALRIERFINEKAREFSQQLIDNSQKIDADITLPDVQEQHFDTPHFPAAFQDLEVSLFKKALDRYKNAKTFFEKNEKVQMREEIRAILQDPQQNYLKTSEQQMLIAYEGQWQQLVSIMRSRAEENVEQYYNGMIHSLSEEIDVERLESVSQQLSDLPE